LERGQKTAVPGSGERDGQLGVGGEKERGTGGMWSIPPVQIVGLRRGDDDDD